MPIVSISRIQHRYGLSENVPQLAAAELGWVIDQRKLYIGNGPTSEGAPEIGNTEILTEYSDLLALSAAYTYKGQAAGYTVQTGASANTPVTRSLQSKFDDMASVKDFGAVGDGVADDTLAINRALYELFCREANIQTRRSLFFPAGTYNVSDEIKIPTYARIYGEGQNCTFIRQTDSDPTCVARVADSLQQVGANIGNNGGISPHFIDVVDITFEQTTSNHVFIINAATNLRFQKVGFIGSITSPTSAGSSLNCISIFSTAVTHSANIMFEQCQISKNNFGVIVDDDAHSITFNGCKFEDLFKAAKLGELTSGVGAAVDGPSGFHFSNSYFNRIYSIALQTYLVNNIFSSFNYFDDVGNQLTGSPVYNVISFGDDGCASVCDNFARTDAEDLTIARIELNNKNNFYLQPNEGFHNGRMQYRPGKQTTLTDNQSSVTTGITFDSTNEKGARIYYTASRGSDFRHGELKIVASSAGSTISDDYQYDGSDIGLTFDLNVSGATTTLRYTTTNTGNDVTFTYGIEHLNY